MRTVAIRCEEVWRHLSEYIDGDVRPGLRARMEAHFRQCRHCTAVLDGSRNVIRLVGDGRSFAVPEGFGARLKARLKRAASPRSDEL